MNFCLLLKIWIKLLVKKYVKAWVANIARNFLIMIKKSAADAPKTSSKRVIQEVAEANYDLFGNKIANKITKVSKKFTTK